MTTGRRRPRGAAQSRQRRRLGGDHLWRWRDRRAGGRTGTWMGSTGFDAEHQSPPTKESRALSEQRRHAVKARPGDIDDLGLGDLVRVPERGRVDAEQFNADALRTLGCLGRGRRPRKTSIFRTFARRTRRDAARWTSGFRRRVAAVVGPAKPLGSCCVAVEMGRAVNAPRLGICHRLWNAKGCKPGCPCSRLCQLSKSAINVKTGP